MHALILDQLDTERERLRFSRRYKVMPSGCWEWIGSNSDGGGIGYGRLQRQGKTFAAHRFSWMLENGCIPDGMLVCHRCDNRRCVNPAHLFLGSCVDNAMDMVNKRRNVRWPRNLPVRSMVLTAESVAAMRSEHAAGASIVSLAEKYGCASSTAFNVVHRHTWRHVA